MADLHETLEKRERRSRLLSFLVGSAIILAIVLVVVLFNNRNDGNGEVADDGVNITATTDENQSADSETSDESAGDDTGGAEGSTDNDSAVSDDNGDDSAAGSDDSSTDDQDAATTENNQDAATTDEDQESTDAVATTGGSEGSLPNTGPEHAIIGLIVVAIAAQLFVRTRSNLDQTLLRK